MLSKKFTGKWINNYGSEAHLEVDAAGRVLGKFRTAVGREETEHLWKNKWFDVTGYAGGDVISFVTNFTEAGVISVVSGKIVTLKNGEQKLETITHTRFSLPEKDTYRENVIASLVYERAPTS
jgi:hypothetical protein